MSINEDSLIKKRSGRLVKFDSNKIFTAIEKAGKTTGEFETKVAKQLTVKAVSLISSLYSENVTVEDVQDVVEQILLSSPHHKTAKAYILYREQHARLREMTNTFKVNLINKYLKKKDWKVNENSNMGYSLQGLNNYISSEISNAYWLYEIYPPDVRKAHIEGDFHIHDLNILSTYTYFGKEVVVAKYRGELLTLSFEQLYDLVEVEEKLLNQADDAWAKYPEDLFVMDKHKWTAVKRLVRKSKNKPMRFVKNRGGRSVIVTEDHPMITESGEKASVDVTLKEDKLFTVDMVSRLSEENLFYKDRIDLVQEISSQGFYGREKDSPYFNGIPLSECSDTDEDGIVNTLTFCAPRYIKLTEEFGFFVGLALAEGFLTYDTDSYFVTLVSKSKNDLIRANAGLIQQGWSGVITSKSEDIFELRVRNRFLGFLFNKVFKIRAGSRNITLPVGILTYSQEFLKGVLAGIIDGDGAANGETGIQIRVSSRTLLEQLAVTFPFIGLFPRDRNCEGVGSVRECKGRTITQNFPIYGLGFRKMEGVEIPSSKWNALKNSTKAWHDETVDSWHEVLSNAETTIPDEYIYDITTDSSTFVVNGMWNHNCVGWDLQDLLKEGFKGVSGKVESKPAKHFRSALGQVVNFFYTLQGEAAGAQAFSSFDTLLAPFIRYDKLSYAEVKQAMQEFVFNMNVPTRVGFQTPFTNVSLDVNVPKFYQDQPVIIGGEVKAETYKDFQEEMDMFNKAFLEVMAEGDAKGRVFTFPIPTYSVTKTFNWDNENLDPLWEMTAKYGVPYFSNFINSDMSPEDSRSMCPLHPNTKVVVKTEKGISIRTIKDVYYSKSKEYKTLHKGNWSASSLISMDTIGCLKVDLCNGENVTFDKRHLQPVKTGKGSEIKTIPTSDIKEGMYIPFSRTVYDSTINSYSAGYAVGAFIGDGSYDKNGELIYSLNDGKKKIVEETLTNFFLELGYSISTSVNDHLVSLRIKGSKKSPMVWMSQFIEGNSAETKKIRRVSFNRGKMFLKGVLDGWYATDGGNKGRIYSCNLGLVDDFTNVCGFLGIHYTVDRIGDRREGRLSTNPVYTMKFHTRDCYSDLFFTEDDYTWFKVSKVSESDYKGKVYCFVVDSKEHLFQLSNGMVTHNCRLRIDNRQLVKRGGGLFGSNPLTGSIGVVTINLPRIGYVAKTESEFFSILASKVILAKESLEIKRKVLEALTDANLYPYVKFYLRDVKARFNSFWKNHFSTIGVIGMNEACLNFLGKDISSPEGQAFTEKILDFCKDMLLRFQEETDNYYNLEATPAEGTSFRLAAIDKQKYSDIICANEKGDFFYTNSTQLPVGYTEDIFEAMDLQNNIQSKYTGGTVFHIFAGERVDNKEVIKNLIKKVCNNYKMPYFTFSPTFSVCPNHGYIAGEVKTCPTCKEECEVYSRVVGYLRPVQQWNKGKKEEFKMRKTFKVTERNV